MEPATEENTNILRGLVGVGAVGILVGVVDRDGTKEIREINF